MSEQTDGAEVCSTELLEQLKEENQKLRIAIQSAIDCANGRESEWGDRAGSAFSFLYGAIDTWGTPNMIYGKFSIITDIECHNMEKKDG